MANTPMPTDSALAVKKWEMLGFIDMYKNTAFGLMASRGSLMRAEELDNARAGDETTFNYTGILTGLGTLEGGTLTGNEEALDNQAFSMVYNVVRHAVSNPNEDTIEQARANFSFADRSRKQLGGWHQSRVDASVFNQLAGVDSTTITVDTTVYSGANKKIVQGLNAVNAPTSDRVIRAGGHANDESITSGDTFTLDLIDAAIEQLARTYPQAESLENEEFDLFLSPEQITDLKRDDGGKITWYTNYSNVLAGGQIDSNPIMTANSLSVRPVAKYANVNIYSRNRVATGENSGTQAAIPNVRRAVLCGKNAIAFASKFSGALEGGNEGNVPLKMFSQLKDYDYIKGLEARMIYGVKKLQFDGQDFGSTVIATYAGPHTN
jgi:hypothetical protein